MGEESTAGVGDVFGTESAQKRDSPFGRNRGSKGRSHGAASFPGWAVGTRTTPSPGPDPGEGAGRVAASGPGTIFAGVEYPSQSWGFLAYPKV